MPLFNSEGRNIVLEAEDKILINAAEWSVMLRKQAVYPMYHGDREDKYMLLHPGPGATIKNPKPSLEAVAKLTANSAGFDTGTFAVSWPHYLFSLRPGRKLRLSGGKLVFYLDSGLGDVALFETGNKQAFNIYSVGKGVDSFLLAKLVADCANLFLGKARDSGRKIVFPLLKNK